MKQCGECGFPLMFAKISDWRTDGTVIGTDRMGGKSQITLMECEELESLFAELSESIGMPLDHILVEAQKGVGKAIYSILPVRHIKRLPENRIFRPQWLTRMAINLASREVAGFGFGIMSLDSYHPGREMVIRFKNPALPERTVGAVLGFYETIEDMLSSDVDYDMNDGDLVIRMSHGSQKAASEERLYLEGVRPGSGPMRYRLCATCGTPVEVSLNVRWDLSRGVITNRITGRREVIVVVQSVNALQRELERELGDEVHGILYEAQRKLSRGRLADEDMSDPDAFWDRYLLELGARGLGYPETITRDENRILVEIRSAYNQTLYAARLAAALEAGTGKPSEIEWRERQKDMGAYTISVS